MNYTKNNLSEGDYNKLYIWVNNTEWTDIEKHVEIINKYTYNKKYLIEQHNSKKCIYPILIKFVRHTYSYTLFVNMPYTWSVIFKLCNNVITYLT